MCTIPSSGTNTLLKYVLNFSHKTDIYSKWYSNLKKMYLTDANILVLFRFFLNLIKLVNSRTLIKSVFIWFGLNIFYSEIKVLSKNNLANSEWVLEYEHWYIISIFDKFMIAQNNFWVLLFRRCWYFLTYVFVNISHQLFLYFFAQSSSVRTTVHLNWASNNRI